MKERLTFEREMRDLDLMEVSPPIKPTHVILVAGYDYLRTGVSFESICLNRMARLLRKGPLSKCTLFNIQSGEVKVYEDVRKPMTPYQLKRSGRIHSTFNSVTSANYTDGVFDKNQSGVMSIMDIYKYIQEIGEREPQTIMELSFFSHGWMGGPILVNSRDRSQNPHARDPNDKDPRTNKDFHSANGINLYYFKNAFNPNGFIWIWGCAFAPPYHQVLHQTLRTLRKLREKRTQIGDETIFQFNFNRQWANTWFSMDPSFFPSPGANGEYPLSFTHKFRDIKNFFRRGLRKTYSSYIANNSGVKCYGALLGTYSDYEKGARFPLMVIPHRGLIPRGGSYPYSDDFTGYINFYRIHLGINIDPENRGYGTYLPGGG